MLRSGSRTTFYFLVHFQFRGKTLSILLLIFSISKDQQRSSIQKIRLNQKTHYDAINLRYELFFRTFLCQLLTFVEFSYRSKLILIPIMVLKILQFTHFCNQQGFDQKFQPPSRGISDIYFGRLQLLGFCQRCFCELFTFFQTQKEQSLVVLELFLFFNCYWIFR